MIEQTTSLPISVAKLPILAQDFLDLKHAAGLKYRSEERYLRYFVRYCTDNYPNDGYVPEDSAYNWLFNSENRSQKTKANMSTLIKNFGIYLFSLGYAPMRIPEIRAPKCTPFVPHIFSKAEMQAIFYNADHIEPDHWYPNMHRCIPVLLRLLYSCGLRISEALSITAADIDFSTNVIKLKETKNGMERLIPMGAPIANVIRKYVDDQLPLIGKDAPIFYYKVGTRLGAHSVYGRFKMILAQSGIPYEGKEKGPRLHDLRHTFAVRSMNQMSDSGDDLYVTLPILAAYLGHSHMSSTERYIRLTEDRLGTITDKMQQEFSEIFPEVSENEEF